jgi:hypothetical protein
VAAFPDVMRAASPPDVKAMPGGRDVPTLRHLGRAVILNVILYLGLGAVVHPAFLVAAAAVWAVIVSDFVRRKDLALVVFVLVNLLLQNFLLALYSAAFAGLTGEAAWLALFAGQPARILVLLLLEQKLLVVGLLAVRVVVEDAGSVVRSRKMDSVRPLIYLLLAWVVLEAAWAAARGGLSLALAGGVRNYASLLLSMLVFYWLGAQGRLPLEKLFPPGLVFWGTVILHGVSVGFYAVFFSSIEAWNRLLGVRYLYFYKTLFTQVFPAGETNARFFTDILGVWVSRPGGILLEPVNYGYLLTFLLVLVVFYALRTQSVRFYALGAVTLVFALANGGKAGLLALAVIAATYLALLAGRRMWRFIVRYYAIAVAGIVIVGFFLAPMVSRTSRGHMQPIQAMIQRVAESPMLLLKGGFPGSAGNLSGNLAFRESAFWIALLELGLVWVVLYGWLVVKLGRRLAAVRPDARLSLWLTGFAVVGLWSFFLLGFFQENIFSLQTNVFILGIPCYIVGLYSSIPSTS